VGVARWRMPRRRQRATRISAGHGRIPVGHRAFPRL